MQLSIQKPARRSTSRQNQGYQYGIQNLSPNKRNTSSISIIKQLIRLLIDKIYDLQLQISHNTEQDRRNKLITISQKHIEKSSKGQPPRISQVSFANNINYTTKIQSLISSLDDKLSNETKINNSPISYMLDQIDIKQIVNKQTEPIKADLQKLKQRFEEKDEQLQNTFNNYEDQLTNLIISFKDSVYRRK